MSAVVSASEALAAASEGRKPERHEVRDHLTVYHMSGLLALEFWGGENLCSVHFASGQSAHCEFVVSMSHCDDVGVRTKSFKVQGFKNLPAMCAQVGEFIAAEHNCLDMAPIVRELRTLCQLDALGL